MPQVWRGRFGRGGSGNGDERPRPLPHAAGAAAPHLRKPLLSSEIQQSRSVARGMAALGKSGGMAAALQDP
jgi:hypothetical protein